jgi:hypothetical protein
LLLPLLLLTAALGSVSIVSERSLFRRPLLLEAASLGDVPFVSGSLRPRFLETAAVVLAVDRAAAFPEKQATARDFAVLSSLLQ